MDAWWTRPEPPPHVDTFFRAQDQDSQSKGVEIFRGIYAKADLLIKPRTCLTKLDIAMEVLCSCGIEPEKMLFNDAFRGTAPGHLRPAGGRSQTAGKNPNRPRRAA